MGEQEGKRAIEQERSGRQEEEIMLEEVSCG